MGCDIHPIVQRRVNGAWENVPLPLDASYGDYNDSIGGRNYSLFAILAGVRMKYQSWADESLPSHTPISEPRGLPNDYEWNLDWRDDNEDDLGDHSQSWLTLKELEEYPWHYPSTHCGAIEEKEYLRWAKSGKYKTPDGWCGGVSGGNIKVVTEEAYPQAKMDFPDVRLYIVASFTLTCAEWCHEFCVKGLTWMRTLGIPEDVRLVFGFDN